MLSIITLPTNFATGTAAVASEFFGDLSPYTMLIVGVLLATIVIEIVVGSLRK